MSNRRPLSHWLLLLALVVLWGSAFGLVKIALDSFTPAVLVGIRVVGAAVLLGVLAIPLRNDLPTSVRFWLFCGVLAATGTCLPFFLISLAQQRIDSGLTGILMAVMPLATMVLAHLFVADERMNRAKVAGCLLGFAGIVVLIGPSALLQLGGSGNTVWYQLAALCAALSYAANAIIARHRPPANTTVASAGLMLAGCAIMLPFGVTGIPAEVAAAEPWPLWAAVVLAVFPTALGTVLFFKLIAAAGPSFMSLINYLIPLWALLVGVLFLGERLQWNALAALLLILVGIGVSETRGRPPPN